MRNLSIFILISFIATSIFGQMATESFTVKHLDNNTKGSDYGIAFLNDNKIVFSSPIKEKKKRGPSGIFEGDINIEGAIIGKEIITDFSKNKISKTGLAYTKDSKTVYFSSNNLKKVYSKTKEFRRRRVTRKKSQLFKATIDEEGNWINIKILPFNSRRFTSESPVLSNDGKQLYFVSNNKKESLGGKDIFVVDINEDGTYGIPKNLGSKINTKGDEVTPFITQDNMLYFASDGRDDTFGKLDVYVSDINKGVYTEPLHLNAPINGEKEDFAFILNNTKTRGYLSSNRIGGKKNNDIYSFNAEGLSIKKCVQEIVGTIKDKETEEVISDAVITLLDAEYNELDQVQTDENGVYTLSLDCDKTYNLTAFNEVYITEEYSITSNSYIDAPELEVNKFLVKKELEEKLNETEISSLEEINSSLNPVYFGFDKSNITTETASELDKVIKILKENKSIQIEIAAYTDTLGSKAYNLKLSERRANETANYLIAKGIDSSRIIANGHGEIQSEKENRKNRRIEFSFTK
ncbi:MAG TPA: hypothetical protein DDZ39_11415 [Flavobacteriaceae bacterium]|jgi:outer membrane protein OmpA-like peptidoglycan-associated protein/ribosomal protein L24E|nr:hypothetical protein [Flavobacteriaceae bacterium]HBS12396.1 hypothetical protein [Flavobacteriaceae bacterium]